MWGQDMPLSTEGSGQHPEERAGFLPALGTLKKPLTSAPVVWSKRGVTMPLHLPWIIDDSRL